MWFQFKLKLLTLFLGLLVFAPSLQAHGNGCLNVANVRATGAPGELNCAQSCHSDGNQVTIAIEDVSAHKALESGYYAQGASLFISVLVSSPNYWPEAGFQLKAVDTTGNTVGFFLTGSTSNSLAAPARYTTMNNIIQQYIEHPQPVTTYRQQGKWNARIAAVYRCDLNYQDEITFYYSALMSNNNDSITGDIGVYGEASILPTPPLHQPPSPQVPIVAQMGYLSPVVVKEDFLEIHYYSQKGNNLRCKVYTVGGKKVKEKSFPIPSGENKKRIPVAELPRGVYVLKILTDDGGSTTWKFVR